MIDIRKEITNSRTLYITKAILYRTRTEKGLEAYEIMKRLVYIAYRMGGKGVYMGYDTFIHYILVWLDTKDDGIYDFMYLGVMLKRPYGRTLFGIDVGIIVNGTYGQIEQQLLNKSKELKQTLNGISL